MNYPYKTKSSSPIIGVIIVNYNSSSCLLKALYALSLQVYKPHQIIIIDNASTEEISDEIYSLNLPIKLIKSPINLGFAAGNNEAVKYLDESVNWIALLNPDAYPYKDWLLEMVKAIDKYPEYACLGSKLICEKEPHLLDGAGDFYHVSGKAWRNLHRKPLIKATSEVHDIFSPCAAAALYWRDAFIGVQGFDEHYFCYYEDIDLAFRFWLKGYKAGYIPTAVVEHTGSVTTKRHSDFYTYHGHRNLVWTYFKNMPIILLIIFLPLHILLNFISIIIFMKRGQTFTILKAKYHAIKGLHRILKQRKIIQKSRVASTFQIFKILNKGLPW